MGFSVGLDFGVNVPCTNCDERAVALHESCSGNLFPKCAKHLKDVQDAERWFAEVTPWSGQNEFGEYYED